MKKLWKCLPKLSRKWKTVRNITFVLLTALLLPAALGWPALTQDGALAKMQGLPTVLAPIVKLRKEELA